MAPFTAQPAGRHGLCEGSGVLFRLSSGKLTILHNFTGGADGATPGALINSRGILTEQPLQAAQTTRAQFFKVDAGHYTLLHTFTGGLDGANPDGRLI